MIHESVYELRQNLKNVVRVADGKVEFRVVPGAILRFVEEMDYRQVAAMIGKSVPAVRVIQHRALGNLRKIMQR